MGAIKQLSVLIGLLTLFAAFEGRAAKSTVCTITVNSDDEREVFRRHLPGDQYEFVELVERGRPDWLAASCRRGVRCDLLIISGHFAGTEFYSSKVDVAESLKVEEIERAQCGESCAGLFGSLKEVYLFGCDSLKPEPMKSAMPEIVRGLMRAGSARSEAERLARDLSVRHGEASRDLMRRLFPNVPVIYGFSALAPYGRVAGPMLEGLFRSGESGDIGSGRPSERLLKLFGPASMVATRGMAEGELHADFRGHACAALDERVAAGAKVAVMHAALQGDMPSMRMAFPRVERFFAALDDSARADAGVRTAMVTVAADSAARTRYLEVARDTGDPALRLRMLDLAQAVGWLDEAGLRSERALTVRDMLADRALGYGEVDLVCTLNRSRDIESLVGQFRLAMPQGAGAAHAAAQACLGSAEARVGVLRALASPDDADVQAAQAYLRHHPITDGRELRHVVAGIAAMKGGPSQARAIDTLARLHVEDEHVLQELARLFARTTSLPVQRAIAEVFIRASAAGLPRESLAATFRKHRVRSPDGEDLIDLAIRRFTS